MKKLKIRFFSFFIFISKYQSKNKFFRPLYNSPICLHKIKKMNLKLMQLRRTNLTLDVNKINKIKFGIFTWGMKGFWNYLIEFFYDTINYKTKFYKKECWQLSKKLLSLIRVNTRIRRGCFEKDSYDVICNNGFRSKSWR